MSEPNGPGEGAEEVPQVQFESGDDGQEQSSFQGDKLNLDWKFNSEESGEG
ncbi:CalY family protein [Streptomyces sp. NRRL B-24572]|uniref:CalY family protein n=1 Tax=Streptomyces sp. NRRL B-24572 TaxID=1962156 RepID=UPI00211B6727|nr:CalY family protein [Streptomyces sp. NRRL B-24572]